MTNYDRGWLAQITSAPLYLRRCNGLPKDGIRIQGSGLRVILAASPGVAVDSNGRITWRGPSGTFSAEPIHSEAIDTQGEQ